MEDHKRQTSKERPVSRRVSTARHLSRTTSTAGEEGLRISSLEQMMSSLIN